LEVPVRRFVPLLLTLAAEVTAVVALHRLWSPPSDLVGRILWVAALSGAWWLLASTVLSVAAQLSRRAGTLRASARLTLPAIRRFTERTLAASVVAGGLLMAPTIASAHTAPVPEPTVDVTAEPEPPTDTVPPPETAPDAPTTMPVRTGRVGDPLARATVGTEQPEPDTVPAEPSTPSPAPAPVPVPTSPSPTTPAPSEGGATGGETSPIPAPTPSTPPAPAASTGSTPPPAHTVATGDNLWDIAALHLATATGRAVTALDEDEVAAYWRRVCDANRERLRSGDVNLIFTGEVIELPPV
jgi:hypothetical protein